MDFYVDVNPAIFGMTMASIAVNTYFTLETTGGTIDNTFKFNDHTVDFGVEVYRIKNNPYHGCGKCLGQSLYRTSFISKNTTWHKF